MASPSSAKTTSRSSSSSKSMPAAAAGQQQQDAETWLPCKKRKASNASSASSLFDNQQSHQSNQQSDHHQSSNKAQDDEMNSTSLPCKKPDALLPCKKRKGSNASNSTGSSTQRQQQQQQQQQQAQLRKSSYDLSSPPSFGDDVALRIRKGSNDDSISASSMLLTLPLRKTSSHDESMLMMIGTKGGTETEAEGGMEELPLFGDGGGGATAMDGAGNPLTEATSATATAATSSSALDHLDALGKKSPSRNSKAANPKATTTTTTGDDSSCSNETFASSGHRILMEAILMTGGAGGGGGGSSGGGGGSSGQTASEKSTGNKMDSSTTPVAGLSPHHHRERKDSFVTANYTTTARDHRTNSSSSRDRSNSTTAALLESFVRDRSDSFAAAAAAGRRDRLESWGGMSDLSVPPMGNTGTIGTGTTTESATAAIAAVAAVNLQQQQQQHMMLTEDHDDPALAATAAAMAWESNHNNVASSTTDDQHHHRKPSSSAVPIPISLRRDRLNSLASLSETSVSNLPLLDVTTGDIQAFVAAAMASVGDQLADLAGAIESVAERAAEGIGSAEVEQLKREMGIESDNTSNNSNGDSKNCGNNNDNDEDDSSSAAASSGQLMIGATSDGAVLSAPQRPRSSSTGSGKISVDYSAVKAAVDAAEAASETLLLGLNDKNSISKKKKKRGKKMAPPPAPAAAAAAAARTLSRRHRRQLPLRGRAGSQTSSNSDEKRSSRRDTTTTTTTIREQASYVPPPPASNGRKGGPIKKRAKRNSPETALSASASAVEEKPTPKVSNRSIVALPKDMPVAPLVVSSSAAVEPATNSNHSRQTGKWEHMYSCLLEFANERRAEATKDMTEDEKSDWVWDGNVPTSYRTKDGKALGRWVNNQRSAKSKGTLNEEREQRLIDAGLKWSVSTPNSWNEMYQELEIYVKEQAKQGKTWDGNVPTNYQIKTRTDGGFCGEDKNLGRWVNRQRSLYQAGKLRKDRQQALDKIGLKWSMLATTSWDSMFETLKEYVNERKKELGSWDGNVPAHYRTDDSPPRALGRWINRQRSAYQKKKLKKECVDKLDSLGLKWAVHSRDSEEIVLNGESEHSGQVSAPEGSSSGNSSGKENKQVAEEEQVASV